MEASDVVHELALTVFESGQVVEEQSPQIQSYSLASGDALKELETNAANAFERVGSSGEGIAASITTLSSDLSGLHGKALEDLAVDLDGLSARFGGIDTSEFTTALKDFNVEGAN